MQRVRGRPARSDGTSKAAQKSSAELAVRITSGLVLAAVAVLMTLSGLLSFTILIMIFVAAMAWEWSRLVRGSGVDSAFAVQLAATIAASWAVLRGCPSCALLLIVAGAVAVFVIRSLRDERAQAWWSATGVYYCGLPAVALIWIRSDAAYGLAAILYLFIIVWTTDSTAYIFGKWIGGPRLAPRVSPKKTWAGLIGGVLSAGLAGLIFATLAGTAFSAWLGLLAVGLALMSQLGDLGESAIKRMFGAKDTSGLIPGHGGVLDRVDGLLFAAVAAGLLAWVIDSSNPGRAILLWS
jgi:phosphatidate cytidylyltransferase